MKLSERAKKLKTDVSAFFFLHFVLIWGSDRHSNYLSYI